MFNERKIDEILLCFALYRNRQTNHGRPPKKILLLELPGGIAVLKPNFVILRA